jgi:Domain of unknown function (DUF4142)
MTRVAVGQAVKASNQDQQFLQHAASDGLAEVQLGPMAAERATNPEVQRFGQRMVTASCGVIFYGADFVRFSGGFPCTLQKETLPCHNV